MNVGVNSGIHWRHQIIPWFSDNLNHHCLQHLSFIHLIPPFFREMQSQRDVLSLIKIKWEAYRPNLHSDCTSYWPQVSMTYLQANLRLCSFRHQKYQTQLKCERLEAKLNSSNKPNPVMVKHCEVQIGQPNTSLSTNSRNKRCVELNAYTGGRSWCGMSMRATREKVAIRQDLERCPLRVESRVMTVKGLYPLVSNKNQWGLSKYLCTQRCLEDRMKQINWSLKKLDDLWSCFVIWKTLYLNSSISITGRVTLPELTITRVLCANRI